MSELPSHTDSGMEPSGAAIAPESRRRRWLIVSAVVGLVALMVVLHLTGVVGAESH
jgi:hypothetical protein